MLIAVSRGPPRNGGLQMKNNTIKIALCGGFVTTGFRALTLLAAASSLLAQDAPVGGAEAVEIVTATNVYTHGALTVHVLTVGRLAANCYLAADAQRNAIVIDPGAAPQHLQRYILDHRLRVAAYVLTHSHLDHISGLDELTAAIPAPVAMHPEENDWAFCEKNEWLPWYPRTREVKVARPLSHQQTFSDGGLHYTVLHTPGHSPGSVCLWFPAEGLVFTGDTLFAGTVGRTDLHRSSASALMRSLGVFLAMPLATVVYAGHGEPTTVAAELAGNPFLRDQPEPAAGDAPETPRAHGARRPGAKAP